MATNKNKTCKRTYGLYLISCIAVFACKNTEELKPKDSGNKTPVDKVVYMGCEGEVYPDPDSSLYVLPFAVGDTFQTGLTNCTSSFHVTGSSSQFAYDFDMPLRTEFMASRAGIVFQVEEGQQSEGGGSAEGNFIIVDHLDGTYAGYYHAPKNGIEVELRDSIEQGQVLGVSGESGSAGYPHLHFTVIEGTPFYRYEGKATTFKNAFPKDMVLKSFSEYTALEY